MATLVKSYIVTVSGNEYILSQELFNTFCLYGNQLVNNYSNEMDELTFRISFGEAWIELTRNGDNFTVAANGRGESEESLTLAEFNAFISICRTSKNCKC